MHIKYLWLEVTDKCNSKCKTCFIWRKTPYTLQELVSASRLKEVFCSPFLRNVEYVINSGGEPVLGNLRELLKIEHACFPKARLQISTNGILPDQIYSVVVETLASNVALDVGVSLDAVGEEHDKFRGVKGNFASVDKLLTELGVLRKIYPALNVSAGSTLTKETAVHAKELFAYAEKKGVFFMWHWPNKSEFYGNENSEMEISPFQEYRCVSMLNNGVYRDYWLASLSGRRKRFRCKALDLFCVIKANGDVAPCLSLWNSCVGNVKNQSLESVLHSEEADNVRCKIASCNGCLNNWALLWSLRFNFTVYVKQFLKRRLKLCM